MDSSDMKTKTKDVPQTEEEISATTNRSDANMKSSPTCLQHDDYSIAIICPMGHESAPVMALLDERHESLPSSRDQNAYTLGRMGPHNIVVAVMPKTGNTVAAVVVTQLLNDFKSIRFGLLVGIGGGIPDEDYEEYNLNDVRLGDVVVSEPKNGFGGVVQFTRGKLNANGSFQRNGHLNAPPHVLSSNIQILRGRHEMEGHQIPIHLNEMFERYPKMKANYKYPGEKADSLFQPDYDHEGGASCRKCDRSRTIQRPEREEEEPKIHYGTIGSSAIVVKDSLVRDQLRKELDILCVEMEAAGLMDAFPGLVIRGICDYADSHKNDIWQRYAAATAAAYAKELVLLIPAIDIKKTPAGKEVMEELGALSSKLEKNMEISHRVETRQLTSEEQDILEWLSPDKIDFSNAQHAARSAHVSGTGQWLLEDPNYVKWRDEAAGLFWLHGVAGCGKTVLCSTVVHDLQQRDQNSHMAYWYFQFSDNRTQSIIAMLRSLIRQLSTSFIASSIRRLEEQHRRSGSQPSLDELITCLGDAIELLDKGAFIVLDALDEYPLDNHPHRRSELLELLMGRTISQGKVHVLVTSRPEPDIREALRNAALFRIDIERRMWDDIREYIEVSIKKPKLAIFGPEATSRIVEKLLSFEERRFRWADLQIKALEKCPTMEHLEHAIVTIPKTLEESYHKAFESIPPKHREEVRTIMMWLISAFEPLKPHEIAATVGYISPDHVLEICTSLLVTIIEDEWTDTIKLAHFSVQEFVISRTIEEQGLSWYKFSGQLAHEIVAIMAVESLLDLDNPLKNKSLLPYSARSWPRHVEEIENIGTESKLQSQIDALFDENHTQQFMDWLTIHDPDKTFGRYPRNGSFSPLYYAALFGLTESLRKLWIDDNQMSIVQGHLGSILDAAAIRGNVDTVNWLLLNCNRPTSFVNLDNIVKNIGRNISETLGLIIQRTGYSVITENTMSAAALNQGNGETVLRILLDLRPDVQISPELVVRAVQNSNGEGILRLLLDRRTDDVHITNRVIEAAASRTKGGAILRLLLDRRPEDIQITNKVVIAAAQNPSPYVMQILLDLWPDAVHVTDEVILAAAERSEAVFELLVAQRPDDIQITDEVVKAAAQNYNPGVMQLLLDRWPNNVHITNEVILAAARRGAVFRLLLARRPEDIQITDGLIKAAAQDDEPGVIQLLLDRWPNNVHITNEVILVAAEESKAVLELLLDRRPEDIRITDDVVKAAAKSTDPDVMQLLLNRRPNDIHVTDKIILKAAAKRSKTVFQVLLARWPEDILITNDMVKAAAKNYDPGVMQLLLDRWPNDVHITDEIISIAAAKSKAVFQVLLARRPEDIRITNDVVKAAAQNRSPHMMQLLLNRWPNDIQITEEVILVAAARSNAVFELLLARRPKDIRIMDDLVKAAAQNYNPGVIQLLLDRWPNDVHITKEVLLTAAAGNKVVFELLVAQRPDDIQITDEVVKAAAQNYDPGVIQLLLDRCPNDIHITDKVILAAAKHSEAVFKLLVAQRPDDIQITDDVVKAAAQNYKAGVMQLLLDQWPNDVHITNEVILTAAARSKAVFKLLVTRCPDDIRIMDDVVKAAAKNYDPGVIQLLLDRWPNDVHITKEVILTAAEESHEVFKLLVAQRPDDIHITDEVVKAAAQNCEPDVIQLLLDRWPNDIHITKEVILAAAAYSEAVFKLLVARRPDDVQITDDVVKAAAQNSEPGVMQLLLDRWPNNVHITNEVITVSATTTPTAAVLPLPLDRWSEDVHITGDTLKMAASNYDAGFDILNLLLDQQNANTIPISNDILRSAATSGCKSNLQLLGKRCGSDINTGRLLDICKLFHSARTGNSSLLFELLATEEFDVDIKDVCNRSLIWWAAQFGHEGIVKHLLDQNVDVNVQSSITGLTPIILADMYGHSSIVMLLLQAGADPTLKDFRGRNASSVIEKI